MPREGFQGGSHAAHNIPCTIEVCGTGVVDPGEQCDDNNTTPGDGCSSTCQVEVNLQLTLRADTPEIRKNLLDGVRRIAENTARAMGAPEALLPAVAIHNG